MLNRQVQAFCDKHLHPVGASDISVSSGPENFEQYLRVKVPVSGTIGAQLNAYDRFTSEWVREVTFEKAERFRVLSMPSK